MRIITEIDGWVPGTMWTARVIEGMAVALCLSPAGWVAILVGVAAGTTSAAGGGWFLKNMAEKGSDWIEDQWHRMHKS